MKTKQLLNIGLLTATLAFGIGSMAEETASEKVNAAANKSADSAREFYRNSKDELCELINGKMECIAKKLMNKSRTAVDKTKTKAKELKDKVD